jgi:hypothetical protein
MSQDRLLYPWYQDKFGKVISSKRQPDIDIGRFFSSPVMTLA